MANYNSLMLHGIKSVTKRADRQNTDTGTYTANILIEDENGNQLTVTMFSDAPLTITEEGSDNA